MSNPNIETIGLFSRLYRVMDNPMMKSIIDDTFDHYLNSENLDSIEKHEEYKTFYRWLSDE